MKLLTVVILIFMVSCAGNTENTSDSALTVPVVTDTEKTGTKIVSDDSTVKPMINEAPMAANENKESKNISNNRSVSIQTFRNSDGTFGYDIMMDGKKYIHQPMIPSVKGNSGFQSEKDAERTASLVKYKIE